MFYGTVYDDHNMSMLDEFEKVLQSMDISKLF